MKTEEKTYECGAWLSQSVNIHGKTLPDICNELHARGREVVQAFDNHGDGNRGWTVLHRARSEQSYLKEHIERIITACNAQMRSTGLPDDFVDVVRGVIQKTGITERCEVEWAKRLNEMKAERDEAQHRLTKPWVELQEKLLAVEIERDALADHLAQAIALLEECRSQFLALPDDWGEALPTGVTPFLIDMRDRKPKAGGTR